VPTTRFEYFVAACGVIAIAVLGTFTVFAWRDYHNSATAAVLTSSAPAQPASTPPSRSAPAPPATPASTTTSASAAAARSTRSPQRSPSLVLSAARGDSWVDARVGGQTGTALYEGMLVQGKSVRLKKKATIWLRLGAPQNLDVRVDGKRTTLPSGTATMQLAGGKLTTLSLG
jgi:hypothetical protein